MRIIVITQDEPFYLAENFKYLLQIMPTHSKVVGCVVTKVSPFGKNESFIKKALKTFNIFGFSFFIHYSLKYIMSKFDKKKKIINILSENSIPKIELNGSINSEKSIQTLKSYNPDILVSILGNQIFKKQIINLAPKGCINLHTAMLPKYRGLMPTFWVLKNNEKTTGVSVFFVDEGIDSGPIIIQKSIDIESKTQSQLIKITKKIGMELIAKSIDMIHSGNLQLIENPKNKSSYYSFPTREDVLIFKRNNKKFF